MEHQSLHEATQALLSSLFSDFYISMQWWIGFAIALIFADLRFGIMAAKKRGEKIRGSRMRRRTMNKILDYGCWLFVAYTCRHSVGVVFGVPVVSVACILYVYLNELSSAGNNYAEYKGLPWRINFRKLLSGRHDLEKALEEVESKKDNNGED